MKQIYKVLMSILVISMLAVAAISAVTGPYTGCVSTSATKYDVKGIFYYFQPGSTPISPCKIGDSQLTIYEKTYIDNALNFLQTQINSLANRVTNLENNQPQIFSKSDVQTNINQNNAWIELNSMTFNLPKQEYVYIEGAGMMYSWLYYAGSRIEVDGITHGDSYYGTGDGVETYGAGGWTGFQNPTVLLLNPGSHTVKIYGLIYGNLGQAGAYSRITAIASSQGIIQSASTTTAETMTIPAPKMR